VLHIIAAQNDKLLHSIKFII